MLIKKLLFFICLLTVRNLCTAQDDLEKMLEATDGKTKELVTSAFKAPRVINLQSLEKVSPGALQFVIQHRFGAINGGAYQFFGLDQATIRIGLEYGINDRIMVGLGRSSYQKTYDGFVKASLIRQHKGGGSPFSLLYFGSTAINSLRWEAPERNNLFSSRVAYINQLLIGRKFSDRISFLIAPTAIHKNLVSSKNDQNLTFALGVGGRVKILKRVALNAEYIYRIPPKDQLVASYKNFHNSLSIGFDIETGGHVFQLHFSNSLPMIEKGFITETSNSWQKGGIHIGFNITRDFVLSKKNSGSNKL